ncbi:MAG: glycosyltransferase family 4 protein [Parvularculaceae bacterium]
MSHSAAEAHGARLRVALFSGNYNYVVDGPVRALNKLVAHLEARGHAALVFAPTIANPPIAHAGELVSVPSVALPGSRNEYRLGLGFRFREGRAAKARLEAFRPNLIHIAAPDLTARHALDYAEANGVAAVASFHTRFDTYPRYYGLKWLEPRLTAYMRRFYARVRHVYAPSQSMIDELARDGVGSDLRLWTRGVDEDGFNPGRRDMAWRRAQGFADDDVVVAFVGRVVLEKAIDVFAETVAAARRRAPRLRALVVGDGPERAHFAARLPNDVFVGYLQDAELARAYASADIFLNPSVTETFGNVTLEAMACGLPSVGASASGSRTLIEDGVTGRVAAPDPARGGGAAAFADILVELAHDKGARARMGAAALAASLDYRWPATLDKLIAHYHEAVSGARGRGETIRSASTRVD